MPLKILFISNCDPQHLFIVEHIRKQWPDTKIVRPVWGPLEPKKGGRVRRFARNPMRSLSNRCASRLQRGIEQRLKTEIAADLYPGGGYRGAPDSIEVSA